MTTVNEEMEVGYFLVVPKSGPREFIHSCDKKNIFVLFCYKCLVHLYYVIDGL